MTITPQRVAPLGVLERLLLVRFALLLFRCKRITQHRGRYRPRRAPAAAAVNRLASSLFLGPPARDP